MSFDWRTLPSLSSLRAFDATARNGGFSGAARSLNVTHAAIAQQVRGLEKELGVQLVARMGRSVSLTDAGARLAASLDDGFSAIAEGLQDLRAQEDRRGLRIATTPLIAHAMIMPRLAEFWEKHPGIEVALFPGSGNVDIVREGFDFGIRTGDGNWPGFDAIHLACSPWIAVGAPSLLNDPSKKVDELPWIVTDDDEFGEFPPLIEGKIDFEKVPKVPIGSYRLCQAAAREGLGLNWVAEIVVQDDLASGHLQRVPGIRFKDLNYYVVVPKGPRREVVTQFIDWLKTIF